VHMTISCIYRAYELATFFKKSEKIDTYSFDPISSLYKILSSNLL
jgi:hypothetical protein